MTKREKVLQRLSHALAWDMSIAKSVTPRQTYSGQTAGCRQRFDASAYDLARCLLAAGLELHLRPFPSKQQRKALGR